MENQVTPQQPKDDKKGLCITSLVLGLVSFFCCNPLYLVSVAAIITGIIGATSNSPSKGMAIAGAVIGGASILICIIVDICLIPFTFGASFFF